MKLFTEINKLSYEWVSGSIRGAVEVSVWMDDN